MHTTDPHHEIQLDEDVLDDDVLTLLEEDLDGRLDGAARVRLDGLLVASPRLAREHRAQQAVAALLAEDRVAVPTDFAHQVMVGLPRAPWETRRGAWALPLAVGVVLAVLSAVILGFGGGMETTAVGGTVTAIADLAVSSLLAGAGLLGASWRGLGMGLEQLFAGSKATLAAFAVLVVSVDLLFVALLLRRRHVSQGAARTDEGSSAR